MSRNKSTSDEKERVGERARVSRVSMHQSVSSPVMHPAAPLEADVENSLPVLDGYALRREARDFWLRLFDTVDGYSTGGFTEGLGFRVVGL
jgi:hypothetical protein